MDRQPFIEMLDASKNRNLREIQSFRPRQNRLGVRESTAKMEQEWTGNGVGKIFLVKLSYSRLLGGK
jgi:hypothetical protein